MMKVIFQKDGYQLKADDDKLYYECDLGHQQELTNQASEIIPGDKLSSYLGPVNLAINLGTSYNNNIIQATGRNTDTNITLLYGDSSTGHGDKKYTYIYYRGDTTYLNGYDQISMYTGQSSSNGIKLNSSGLLYKGHALNTAQGLVQLNSSGKLPSGAYGPIIDTNSLTVQNTISVGGDIFIDGTSVSYAINNYAMKWAGTLSSTVIPSDTNKIYYQKINTSSEYNFTIEQLDTTSLITPTIRLILDQKTAGAGATYSIANVYWQSNGVYSSENTAPSLTLGKATIIELTNYGDEYWCGKVIAVVPTYQEF